MLVDQNALDGLWSLIVVGIGQDSYRKTECRDSTGEQRPASGSYYYIYYTVRWNEIQWNGKLRQQKNRNHSRFCDS